MIAFWLPLTLQKPSFENPILNILRVYSCNIGLLFFRAKWKSGHFIKLSEGIIFFWGDSSSVLSSILDPIMIPSKKPREISAIPHPGDLESCENKS